MINKELDAMLCQLARYHHLERASALDFKDPAAPIFGHSDVVFDLFTETFFAFNRPLIPWGVLTTFVCGDVRAIVLGLKFSLLAIFLGMRL